MIALQEKRTEIAYLLLEHPKLDVSLVNKLGHTAWKIATDNNDSEIAQLIEKKHANDCLLQFKK